MADKNQTLTLLKSRIYALVDRAGANIKDQHQRESFRKSVLGAAHPEPGTHESAQVGVPDHLEPGVHEQAEMASLQDPVGESQPVAGGLGVPGAELGGGDENGTVDLCALCGQEDQPGSCTCLGGMQKSDGDMAGPTVQQGPMVKMAGTNDDSIAVPPPLPPATMVKTACKKCAGMHRPMEKCGDMTGAVAKKGETSAKAKAAPALPGQNPATKPVDPKSLPGGKAKTIASPGSGSVSKPKGGKDMKKAAVPAAVPPSGGLPGGTGAAPMASNTSKPKLKTGGTGIKPPPPPGPVVAPKAGPVMAPKAGPLGKAALPAAAKAHALSDESRAAAPAPAPKPGAAKPGQVADRGPVQASKDMAWLQGQGAHAVTAGPKPPGFTPGGTRPVTPNVPAGRGASIPGFSPGATGGGTGPSFQPQPRAPAARPAPAPVPKRSLFSQLFGKK